MYMIIKKRVCVTNDAGIKLFDNTNTTESHTLCIIVALPFFDNMTDSQPLQFLTLGSREQL